MKQPIAGLTPHDVDEVTVMTVWPSNAAYAAGRWLGRGYAVAWPNIYIFRLGNLIALLSIPVAVVLYFWKVFYFVGRRYRLTNRRIVIEKGVSAAEMRSIDLDRFDTIDVEVLPGQAWYRAGDLVFRSGGREAFRLAGVSHPEAFRSACLKAHTAYVSVNKVQESQLASA